MKNFWLIGACAALFLAVFALTPEVAMASGAVATSCDPGTDVSAARDLYNKITGFISGTPGILVGLVLALAGAWLWIVQQSTATGILFLVFGAILTLFPKAFQRLVEMGCDIFK